MTDIQAQVAHLQRSIFEESYFVALWQAQLAKRNMTTASIVLHQDDDSQLVLLCQDMWDALPDNPSIRRFPFFLLCDVAEQIFDL